jgi:TPR repeat protein
MTMSDPSLAEPYFNLGNLHELGLGTERDFRGAY